MRLAADSAVAPLKDNSTLLFTAKLCLVSVKLDRERQQQSWGCDQSQMENRDGSFKVIVVFLRGWDFFLLSFQF